MVAPAGGVAKNPAPVAVIPGNFVNVTRYYTPRFNWSPDSKWITYLDSGSRLEDAVFVCQVAPSTSAASSPSSTAANAAGDPVTPAVAAAATGVSAAPPRPIRITEWMRSVNTPRWSKDGRMIYFAANPVDNWDIYAVDLQPRDQTFAEDDLDKLDPETRKPAGKSDGPPAPAGKSDSTPSPGETAAVARQAFVRTADGRVVPITMVAAPAAAPSPTLPIEFAGIEKRMRRLTTSAAADIEPVLMPDGKTLYYQSEGNIWSVSVEPDGDGRPTQVTGNGGIGLEFSEDGRSAYFLSGGRLFAFAPATRTLRQISFQATMKIDLLKENQQIFNETWWVLDRYFYDARHHGVNWQAIKQKYQSLLAYAPYREDFYDLMAEMVQELDASHLGISGPSTVEVELA